MAAFDVPALTRGISGLFTADAERKQKEQERAREQQRQVMTDLLSKRRVEEFEASGRARRQQQAAAAEERKLRAAEVEAGQRQRADFILEQLGAEDLQGIEGVENQTLTDQLKSLETALRRKRTKADRVPRGQGGQLSVNSAFNILKDRYAKFEDDGSGKLVFSGYEKPLSTILSEARELARGGQMTPQPPEPEVVEEGGPGFFKKLGQTIIPGGERGFLPPRTPSFSREETQQRALALEAEGKSRDEIRRIMQSEGYRVE